MSRRYNVTVEREFQVYAESKEDAEAMFAAMTSQQRERQLGSAAPVKVVDVVEAPIEDEPVSIQEGRVAQGA